MDQEIKRKAIELLKEQGPDKLLRHIYRDKDTRQYCAVGAIAAVCNAFEDRIGIELISMAVSRKSGITEVQINRLITINDTGTFDELIAYMETL